MAKKFLVFAASAAAAAIVTGVVTRQRRRDAQGTTARSRPVPVTTTAAENARRFSTEWRADDADSQQFASAAQEEAVAAH